MVACGCQTIGAPATVRFCDEHHRYWKGDKELVSVTKVLKSVWPVKPNYSNAPEDVLENARIRGSVVDSLFSAYIDGWLDEIPPGTRKDAEALFWKLKAWWDGRHNTAKAQVILADDNIAGTCDVIAEDCIYDLKTVSKVDPSYHLQVAAYAQLYYATFQRPARKLAIIHVNKDLRKPTLISVDMTTALPDWMLIRDTWLMAKRRCVCV